MPRLFVHGMSESALGKASSDSGAGDKDSSVCPTCGQVCKSQKGMYQHHKRTHGESISKTNIGCDHCGKVHERWKSQLNGGPYYCSNECRMVELSEKHEPNYRRYELECSLCGETVERRASELKHKGHIYCSRECAEEDHAKRMSADGNPRWAGGHDRYYGENWKKQRNKARKRDDYTCQRCGVCESELDRSLSVHHKVPLRKYDNWREANELENLITLCRSCHGVVESWPVQPI